MAIDVTMPKLSDTMEEGKILRWMKQVGDPVKLGEILAEVETDKANMELEAYDEGTLSEVKVEEGQSAPVGSVIAVLSAPGEEAQAKPAKKSAPKSAPPKQAAPAEDQEAAPAEDEKPSAEPKRAEVKAPTPREAAKPAPVAKERPASQETAGARDDAGREPWRPTVVRRPAPAEERSGERVRASPLARRVARDHDLDLASVRGTGPGGRIVEADVASALEGRGERPAAQAKRVAEPAPRTAEAPKTASAPRPGGRVELSRIRRTTAKRMAEAKREVPHFYASSDISMDEAVHLKESLVALGAEYEKLTYTHLILKATGIALRRIPQLNASYDGDAMVLHDAVNIGMATAIEDGLVVLVVRGCDRASLAEIAQQTTGLLERARSGRFASDDMSGGTFTVSNLGMLPVAEFAAIINQPQAAILAVGAIRDVPVVRAGQVVPGKIMTVTLSSDHRIIDGVLAGRFLRELKALLENPLALVV
jgi:pyruvate dehydrogenase E2 component (dihydrolipoyllysine-residue acetyltransferase)